MQNSTSHLSLAHACPWLPVLAGATWPSTLLLPCTGTSTRPTHTPMLLLHMHPCWLGYPHLCQGRQVCLIPCTLASQTRAQILQLHPGNCIGEKERSLSLVHQWSLYQIGEI